MNSAERAMEQLSTWADLHPARPSCGVGQALLAGNSEILHFHSRYSADLRLSVPVIRRLREELGRSALVRLQAGSPWATIRLESESGVRLMLTLTSLALHEHGLRQGEPAPEAPCSLGRDEVSVAG